jgi:anaerobic magnesium-protoporphyrin IX monomethyl ester cyclase
LSNPEHRLILFNPRSALHNHRLPISLLQVGASVFGKEDFVFVDGNLERDPWSAIDHYLKGGEFDLFASTVMPGPQLEQAALITQAVKRQYPGVTTIWGGYFPSLHYRVCMESGMVDYIIRGPGDHSFPKLLGYLKEGKRDRLSEIGNLVFRDPSGTLTVNPMDPVPDQDFLPRLPLDFLGKFYPVERYIVKTFIGNRTLSFHSSAGCPHACGFCGVASVYNSSWKGKSARIMVDEIMELKNKYRIDALEFLDSNFFCSHSRTMEFCGLMRGQNIRWWAEGRVDTLNQYPDEELRLIRDSGCVLVFMGAESGNDQLLSQINKGPGFRSDDTREVVRRFRHAGIIPELSFVLGLPDSSPDRVMHQIRDDIRFIRSLKRVNPDTEVVLYLFSPVPFQSSKLNETVQRFGLEFPASLSGWLTPEWKQFDLRRGFVMPWMNPHILRFIRNFEVVMAAAYPGKSNFQISRVWRTLLTIPGRFRYRLRWYRYPFEIKALLKLLSYRRPAQEGFYSE